MLGISSYKRTLSTPRVVQIDREKQDQEFKTDSGAKNVSSMDS